MTKLVCGVGFNDGKYPALVKGKIAKEYHIWNDLLRRCCDHKYQQRQPTYLGCSISDGFKNYSYFHDWCQRQIGFGQEDFQLDKDFLIKGSKIYSEDTCLFLPRELNALMNYYRARRESLPLGITTQNGRFRAQCYRGKSVSRHLGYFDTPEEAFQAYKQAKEAYIKAQAEKWKALIDPRAYAALMTYTVSITD